MTIALSGAPLRVDDQYAIRLKARDGETNVFNMGTVDIIAVSVAVQNNNILTQNVTATGYTTPVYEAE